MAGRGAPRPAQESGGARRDQVHARVQLAPCIFATLASAFVFLPLFPLLDHDGEHVNEQVRAEPRRSRGAGSAAAALRLAPLPPADWRGTADAAGPDSGTAAAPAPSASDDPAGVAALPPPTRAVPPNDPSPAKLAASPSRPVAKARVPEPDCNGYQQDYDFKRYRFYKADKSYKKDRNLMAKLIRYEWNYLRCTVGEKGHSHVEIFGCLNPPYGNHTRLKPKKLHDAKWLPKRLLNATAPPPPVKLVLGVLSTHWEPEVRQAHRDTWLLEDGVCGVEHHQDDSCHTFPLFVLGATSGREGEASHLADADLSTGTCPLLLLNVTDQQGRRGKRLEEDRNAKICSWMHHVLEAHPWATHVGKMDSDSMPWLQGIQMDLRSAPRMGMYYGSYMGYQPRCTLRLDSGEYAGMQGSLWAVTPDVARIWLRRRANGSKHCGICPPDNSNNGGPEDLRFGPCLAETATLEDICVACVHTHAVTVWADLRKFQQRWVHPVR